MDHPTAVTRMSLNALQPSQFYVSATKLASVLERFLPAEMEPLPIRPIRGRTMLTDGHTRALAAHLHGLVDVPVHRDEDDLDWLAYERCVDQCLAEGVHCAGDLVGRVLPHGRYVELWNGWCDRMHAQLEAERKEAPGP